MGNPCTSSSGRSGSKNKKSRFPLHPHTSIASIEAARHHNSKSSLPILHEVHQESSSRSESKVKLTPVKPKRIEKEISKAYQELIRKHPQFENSDTIKKELQSCLAPLPAFHGRRLITRVDEQGRCQSLNSINTLANLQQQINTEMDEEDEASRLLRKLFTNEAIISHKENPTCTLITEHEPLERIYTLSSSRGNQRLQKSNIPTRRVSIVKDASPQPKPPVSFRNFKLFEETFFKINLPQSINKENFDRQSGVEKGLTERGQNEGSRTERRSIIRPRTRSNFRIGTECSEERSVLARSNSKIVTGKETKSVLNITGNNPEKRISTSEGESVMYLRNKNDGTMLRVINGDIHQGLSLNDLSKKEKTAGERRVVSCNSTQKNLILNGNELKDTSIMNVSDSNDMEMYMRQIEGNKNL